VNVVRHYVECEGRVSMCRILRPQAGPPRLEMRKSFAARQPWKAVFVLDLFLLQWTCGRVVDESLISLIVRIRTDLWSPLQPLLWDHGGRD